MRLALQAGLTAFAALALAACLHDCAHAAEPDMQERQQVERYLAACSRTGPHSDPWLVLGVVRAEAALGIPEGLLAAVACWESGYTVARGDWRDGYARAHGPLQLWPWFSVWCGLTDGARDDIDAAARCYWRRVEHYLARPEVQACKRPLEVAEALAANGVKYRAWKCSARSLHAVEWERWRGAERVRAAVEVAR